MGEFMLVYLLVGAIAGLLAGLLGVGGGLVIVPALAWSFALRGFPAEYLMQLAVGSSLATILFTSLASVRAHHGRGSVRWDLWRAMLPGILFGALAGALLARGMRSDHLRIFFGLFECLVALQLLFGLRAQARDLVPDRRRLLPVGGLIGLVSALLGIGGGTLTVPYLRWRGVDMRQAVGTAAASGLPIALAGTVGFWLVGRGTGPLPAWSSGFLYWPAIGGIVLTSVLAAPLGAALAHRLPRARLQRLFGVVLLVIGVRMLVS
jgi:uncharacterized membrane protein YfcA